MFSRPCLEYLLSEKEIEFPYLLENNPRISFFFFSQKLRILIEFYLILLNKIWQKLRITFECGLHSSAGCFRRNTVVITLKNFDIFSEKKKMKSALECNPHSNVIRNFWEKKKEIRGFLSS